MDYLVRDISLYPSGDDKIEWVRRNMPLLRTIESEFVKERPFEGVNIALSVHLEAKTAYLCKVLKAGGANMYVTGSNPLSTQDDVAAALAHDGMHVYALHACNDIEYRNCLRMVLSGNPTIIIDDGADLCELILSEFPVLIPQLMGGCEETTTGLVRLRAMERDGRLTFPMIAVNDAMCKHLFDNRYGTGQSVFDGIDRTTNLIVAGKTVVIAGYGWCGKGVAMRAKGLGAKVIVTEVDPIKAIEAVMDGFAVMPMLDAAELGELFITVTGDCDVIGAEAFMRMKDGAILCNAGHFNVEVNVEALEAFAVKKRQMKPNIMGYLLPNGKWVYLLAEGRLVNLASGDGHPAEIMDMSFAILALCARYVRQSCGTLKAGLHPVPVEIDNRVAEQKLLALGVYIDELTKKQREYMTSWQL